MFKKNYPHIPVFDFRTEELNNIEAFTMLYKSLGIEYDNEKLRNIIGTRANSTPRAKSLKLGINTSLIDEFSRSCETEIKRIFNKE